MESVTKTQLTPSKGTLQVKHIQFLRAGSELLLLAKVNTAKSDAASIYLGQSSYVRVTHGTEQCRFERPQMKVFEKTVQKQATLWITVGKRTGFEPLFGPLLDTFLNKSLNFFDLVYSRYSDPSGDFAPLPCTVYLVYYFFTFENFDGGHIDEIR